MSVSIIVPKLQEVESVFWGFRIKEVHS